MNSNCAALAENLDVKPPDAVESEKWGRVGEGWMVAGTGGVTHPDKEDPKQCGRFYGVMGCLNVDGHNITTLDGKNHKGMMYGKKMFRYCNDPRCPVCHDHGWDARESRRAVPRLLKAKKCEGKIEHITVSPPQKDWGWVESPEKERVYRRIKLKRMLDAHGIKGGLIIFHPARYANADEAREKGVPFGFYFSPHYHVVGFIKGGYSRCRSCSHNNKYDRDCCRMCQGFEGRVRRLNEKYGFIVKVLGERKTIFGTIYYQLDHCGVSIEEKGYHNVTWFGTVSYRALRLKEGDFEEFGFEHNHCPLCQRELEQLRYLGSDLEALAREFWVKEFEAPLYDNDGMLLWAIKDKSAWRG